MSHPEYAPRWRTTSALAALLLLLAVPGACMPHQAGDTSPVQSAEAQPLVGPVLLVYLTPSSIEVRAVEKDAVLQFTGQVEVQQPVLMRSDVALSASCYWPATVNPDTLEFQGSFKQTFTVNVIVPAGTLPQQRQTLEVVGSVKTPGLPAKTANATSAIYIADYPLLAVQYDVMQTHFKAGHTHDIKLTVESKAGEDLELTVTGSEDPDSPKAELRGGPQTIPAREGANVTVRVTVPKNAEGGTQTLHLRLTATTRDGGYEYKMMLSVPCEVDASITSTVNKRGVLYMVAFVIVAVIAVFYLLKGSWWGGKRFRRWRAARKAARGATHGTGPGPGRPSGPVSPRP